jgi:hypothetical protein
LGLKESDRNCLLGTGENKDAFDFGNRKKRGQKFDNSILLVIYFKCKIFPKRYMSSSSNQAQDCIGIFLKFDASRGIRF